MLSIDVQTLDLDVAVVEPGAYVNSTSMRRRAATLESSLPY